MKKVFIFSLALLTFGLTNLQATGESKIQTTGDSKNPIHTDFQHATIAEIAEDLRRIGDILNEQVQSCKLGKAEACIADIKARDAALGYSLRMIGDAIQKKYEEKK